MVQQAEQMESRYITSPIEAQVMLAIDNIDIQNGRQEVSYMLPLHNGILQHQLHMGSLAFRLCGSMCHTVVSFIFFRFLKSASQRRKNNGCSLPMNVHLVSFVQIYICSAHNAWCTPTLSNQAMDITSSAYYRQSSAILCAFKCSFPCGLPFFWAISWGKSTCSLS